MHPRDQWFKVYAFDSGEAGAVLVGAAPKEGEKDARKIEARWIRPPKWGPESETEHLTHPDGYHPDARVRVNHHRGAMRQGFSVAACGMVHDPRMRFIETEDGPKNPCAGCLAAREKAEGEHAEALAALEARAEERKRSLEPALPELGAAVVPEQPEADKVDP